MTRNLKIAAMVAIEGGLNILNFLKDRIKIDFLIGLKPPANPDAVSGYVDISDFARKENIPYYLCETYSLTSSKDIEVLSSLDFDIALVLGWQRLLPSWLIARARLGCLGIHGSPWGITKGRGRSPQNWALILGESQFEVSIFKIDEKIDSGNILRSTVFKYSVFDDIQVSYFKTSVVVAEMIIDLLSSESIESEFIGVPQEGEPRYLPKRTPEDGGIDWSLSMEQIYNFVRALTSPYPGAFTKSEGIKIKIFRGIPFEVPVDLGAFRIGEIAHVFHNGQFSVRCADGFFLVREWSSEKPWEPRKGAILESVSFERTLENIVSRHLAKYPELKVSEKLLALLNRGNQGSSSQKFDEKRK